METDAERSARHNQAYWHVVAMVRDKAILRGDKYDAAYWSIELETRGALSSRELHRRATAAAKR